MNCCGCGVKVVDFIFFYNLCYVFNIGIGRYIFKENLVGIINYWVINYVVMVGYLINVSGILVNIIFFVIKGIFKCYGIVK